MTKVKNRVGPQRHRNGVTVHLLDTFPWGRVLAVHNIGDISIIEYAEKARDGVRVLHEESGERRFHAYIKGRDTSWGASTLYRAVVGAIVYRFLGLNEHALIDGLFRMLKL